ncbi:MAG: hypothetical protein OEX82_07730, partial [Nitrosomonas sp.]|nr:hypothetical protein [Nitrosomonas sp.]
MGLNTVQERSPALVTRDLTLFSLPGLNVACGMRQSKLASSQSDDLINQVCEVNGVKVLAVSLEGA